MAKMNVKTAGRANDRIIKAYRETGDETTPSTRLVATLGCRSTGLRRWPGRNPRLGKSACLRTRDQPALAQVRRLRSGLRSVAERENKGRVPEGAWHKSHHRNNQRRRRAGPHHLGVTVPKRPGHHDGGEQ